MCVDSELETQEAMMSWTVRLAHLKLQQSIAGALSCLEAFERLQREEYQARKEYLSGIEQREE